MHLAYTGDGVSERGDAEVEDRVGQGVCLRAGRGLGGVEVSRVGDVVRDGAVAPALLGSSVKRRPRRVDHVRIDICDVHPPRPQRVTRIPGHRRPIPWGRRGQIR